MKYNPKVNERVARFPGFAGLHPAQPLDTLQGALELMYLLERALCELPASRMREESDVSFVAIYDRRGHEIIAFHRPEVTPGPPPAEVFARANELREAGVWSVAATLDGDPADGLRLDGPIALVVGAEDKGVRKTVGEACDMRARIELARDFDSLNAAVAAGVLLYEIQRQRRHGSS